MNVCNSDVQIRLQIQINPDSRLFELDSDSVSDLKNTNPNLEKGVDLDSDSWEKEWMQIQDAQICTSLVCNDVGGVTSPITVHSLSLVNQKYKIYHNY